MSHNGPPLPPAHWIDRRRFLDDFTHGLAGVAAAALLGAERASPAATRGPHFAPRAKRVIQVFCPGGVSHMDTFDHKPALEKWHGKPLPGGENLVSFQGANGNVMKSPWSFPRRGQSGKPVTELLPRLGELVDSMAFVHSMTSKTNTHGPACCHMNTGFVVEGFPSAGAWVSYGLGTENDNLPAYVAIPDVRGIPPSGPANWGAGFLPAEHQAIVFNAAEPIADLARPAAVTAEADHATLDFLGRVNRAHAPSRAGDAELGARIAAYELAARMQLAAPDAADLSKESRATRDLYGADDPNPLLAAYARNSLLAVRLIERGVRFVQLYCGSRASGVDGLLNWDCHKTLKEDYERHCRILDRPTAALLTDLRGRGLLDDTLVVWTTEFGRMPTHQAGTLGRDHNPDAFTVWLAGAGVRAGTSYGSTDELGRRAEKDPATVYDFYATVLHLLGLDHKRLSFYHNGIERRLTDVHGHVISDVVR
jgi:hypothetical protein